MNDKKEPYIVFNLSKDCSIELNKADRKLLVPGLTSSDLVYGQALLSLLKRLNLEYRKKYLLADDEDAKAKHHWLTVLIGKIENKRKGSISTKMPKLVSAKSISKYFDSLIKEFRNELKEIKEESIKSKIANELAHLDNIEAHIFNTYGFRLHDISKVDEQDHPYVLNIVKKKVREIIRNFKKSGGKNKDLTVKNIITYYVRTIPPAVSIKTLTAIVKEEIKQNKENV